MLRHFRRLGVHGNRVLRGFRGLGVGANGVRLAGGGGVSLVRFGRMRTMVCYRLVGFGQQPEQAQGETGDRSSNQQLIAPEEQFGGPGRSL